MNVRNLSTTLKRLLFEHNLNAMELARLTQIPQPTMQRLVAGTTARPHEKSLIPIAKYFGMTVEQLRGQTPITASTQPKIILEELGIHKIPLLSWKQVEDWLLSPATRDKSMSESVLTEISAGPGSFALRLKDASMEPAFPIGTTVIFDSEKEIKDRYYILIKIKSFDEPVFRQLLLNAGERFIRPISPDLEQFQMYRLNEEDRILGVLIEAKQQYL